MEYLYNQIKPVKLQLATHRLFYSLFETWIPQKWIQKWWISRRLKDNYYGDRTLTTVPGSQLYPDLSLTVFGFQLSNFQVLLVYIYNSFISEKLGQNLNYELLIFIYHWNQINVTELCYLVTLLWNQKRFKNRFRYQKVWCQKRFGSILINCALLSRRTILKTK